MPLQGTRNEYEEFGQGNFGVVSKNFDEISAVAFEYSSEGDGATVGAKQGKKWREELKIVKC